VTVYTPSRTTADQSMTERLGASDVAVVIPTRDRWPILMRTLAGLDNQTVKGFEIVVVVDGDDQAVPDLPGVNLFTKQHGGPGAARNFGARSTKRRIVLFLGDDMVPDATLVDRHIAAHQVNPEEEVGVLGHASWHPEVSGGRLQRWMDWSGTQFDFATIVGNDAGFGRFYSCNVSLKREFFLDSGGFDEAFTYYYEDLDCGWRLGQKGMRLLYEPAARTSHLHRYDNRALERRFEGVGSGEQQMASKHAWFEPYFLSRVRAATQSDPPNRLWPILVDLLPKSAPRLRKRAESRADAWYYRMLASSFLAGWAAASDLAELKTYLGEKFDYKHLAGHELAMENERTSVGDEEAFYRTSHEYLYDLTVFAMSGTKAPYHSELRALVPCGSRMLDYGCGIGADGLRLLSDGYDVSFADFANPSTDFLRWRLERRGSKARVFDLDSEVVPGGYDIAYSFDVIEHVEDPFDFLVRLEQRARLVAINFLEEDPDDTDLHRPLPIGKLLDHAAKRGLLRYRLYHDRSHFVVYRSPGGPPVTRLHSTIERRLGSRMSGRSPWYPLPVS